MNKVDELFEVLEAGNDSDITINNISAEGEWYDTILEHCCCCCCCP